MNGKIAAIAMSIVCTITLTNNAAFKMICLEKASSGQDQKLYGHYHTSYSTADHYHCYFTFNPDDIKWVSYREALNDPELKKLPYLPSYQAHLIYFVNSAPYLTLIEALKQPGKTLKQLRSIKGAEDAPLVKTYTDIKKALPLLTH